MFFMESILICDSLPRPSLSCIPPSLVDVRDALLKEKTVFSPDTRNVMKCKQDHENTSNPATPRFVHSPYTSAISRNLRSVERMAAAAGVATV